jgi:hypothetical protein
VKATIGLEAIIATRPDVLIGLVLVAAGLVIYAFRDHSHRQDHDAHDRLVQDMGTPLMKALRRPAPAGELGQP